MPKRPVSVTLEEDNLLWLRGRMARYKRRSLSDAESLSRPTREFFRDLFSNPSYQAHTLDVSQVFDAGGSTALRDPFDALICAAALDLSLPLITRDAAILEARRVKTVW